METNGGNKISRIVRFYACFVCSSPLTTRPSPFFPSSALIHTFDLQLLPVGNCKCHKSFLSNPFQFKCNTNKIENSIHLWPVYSNNSQLFPWNFFLSAFWQAHTGTQQRNLEATQQMIATCDY